MSTRTASDLAEAKAVLVRHGSINPVDTIRLVTDDDTGCWVITLADGRRVEVTNEPLAPDLAEQAADLLAARARFDAEGQRLAELALLCSMPTEGVSWTPKGPKRYAVLSCPARDVGPLVAQMKGEVQG